MNPCDLSLPVPNDIPSFEHQPPLIAYRNQTEESSPYTLMATVDNEGKPIAVPITETGVGEHFQGDASMAGLIYQGEQLPETYHGAYFHADFRGWIKTMQYDLEQGIVRVDSSFHKASEKIVALAEHPISGYLYYISLEDKKLHRIKYGGPAIPHIEMTATPLWGESPLEVIFDASESFSSDSPLSFYWNFGEGSMDTSAITTHVFDNTSGQAQSFDIELSVQDTFGQERTKSLSISINNTPPKATITHPTNGDRYPIDLTSLIRLGANVEDEENEKEDLQYEWEVFLHHNTHFHPSSYTEERDAFALIAPLGCYTDEYWYRIHLTVIDPQGASVQDEVLIYPECGTPFLEFINLIGKVREEKTLLEWEDTALEPVAYYELQRTEDFLHFSSIARSEDKELVLQDDHPLYGANIYRIKAVDTSGAFRFSDFVIINFPADFTFTLFPNPMFGNSLTLELEQAQEEYIGIRIFDALGRLLIEQKVNATIGEPLQHKTELTNWSDGLYYFLLENGNERSVRSFVK